MVYYSKNIMNHFMHPRYVGSIEDAHGVGDTQNLKCGDIMKMYIRIGKKRGEEYIKDIRFETMGCGHAIAISDMICGLAKGKTLEEAKKITFNDIAEAVGEVPKPKLHCIRLAETALQAAIEDYEQRPRTPTS